MTETLQSKVTEGERAGVRESYREICQSPVFLWDGSLTEGTVTELSSYCFMSSCATHSGVMSSKGTNFHNKRLPSETEHAQRVPESPRESTQHMRLRERQRFFEEVFQHDVDVYLSSAHLQIDYMRPPLGSISSMEVNVDMLEQMDLLDISDHDVLDVFFSASGEEGALTTPIPDLGHNNVEEGGLQRDDVSSRIPDPCEVKSRMLSTSSNSTCDSQASNDDGSKTPIVESDDEDNLLQTEMPTANDQSALL
ncbi:dysbindin-like [Myxocyprinus asiaticus]|uniref:dysbindin-like n=1 Tax=Myxocyprinus asiaticus TaxID=70543 RepID=UPI0022217B7C|nr:dysbindin-like [Myxocyprinus asiaticus]